MKPRTLWFVVGAGAGVYTSVKARRLAYRLTPSGLADQAAAIGAGVRAFGDEVRVGMTEREAQIADELGMPVLEAGRRDGIATGHESAGQIEQRGTSR